MVLDILSWPQSGFAIILSDPGSDLRVTLSLSAGRPTQKLRMAYSIAGYGSKLLVNYCYFGMVGALSFVVPKAPSVNSIAHLLIPPSLVAFITAGRVPVVIEGQSASEMFRKLSRNSSGGRR